MSWNDTKNTKGGVSHENLYSSKLYAEAFLSYAAEKWDHKNKAEIMALFGVKTWSLLFCEGMKLLRLYLEV